MTLYISDSSGGGVSQREFVKLRKQNQSLKEENNLLKLKMEILLDMVRQNISTRSDGNKNI